MDSSTSWDLDVLMEAAKNNEWAVVFRSLEPSTILLNERPSPRRFGFIHHAAWFDNKDAFDQLLELGASLALKTSDHRTARDIAMEQDAKRVLASIEECMEKKGTLRVFSMNTYLIPSWFVNENNPTCTKQDWRAESIGRLAEDKDVVVLQEVWGSSIHLLQKPLVATHDVLKDYSSWGGTFIDTLRCYARGLGGLWCAYSALYPCLFSRREGFSFSNTKSGKGVTCMLLDLGVLFPGNFLLVFNTHLDPSNQNRAQERQLDQVAAFMESTAVLIKEKQLCELSSCGAILCGDFNIHDRTGDYKRLIEKLQVRDLHQEFATLKGTRPEMTYEGVNSLAWNENCRLDYMFAADKLGAERLATVQVDYFTVCRQEVGEELSDHWGIEAELKIR